MKKPVFTILLFYILLIICVIGCAMLFQSCRTVKEVSRVEKVYDSTAINERDSIIQVKQEQIARLENEIREIEYSGVMFDTLWLPGDTVINTVTIKADGSIEAAGRIKAATVTKEKIQRQYSELIQRYDSLAAVKQKTEVRVQWKEKIVEKKVKRGIPFFLLIIVFVSGCLFWHFTGKKILSFFK